MLLEKHFVSPQKQDGRTISRWRRILTSYHNIRELVTIHDDVMTTTNLQLYELNQTTLMKWYDKFNKCTIKVSHNQYLIIYSLIYYKLRWNNRQKTLEKKILLQALPQPPPRAATKPLPPAKPLLPKPLPTPPTPHTFITIPTLPTKTPTQQQLPSTPTTSSTQIYNSPTTIPVPRTTEYRHRKRQEQEEPEAGGSKRKYQRKATFNTCNHCKLPKTKDFGHSRHIGVHSVDTFCPAVEGKQYGSKEAWMKARKAANPPKPKGA